MCFLGIYPLCSIKRKKCSNSGDSGEIKISFTNYYTKAEDREYEGAILRIYYAVKGDIIAFSRDSV